VALFLSVLERVFIYLRMRKSGVRLGSCVKLRKGRLLSGVCFYKVLCFDSIRSFRVFSSSYRIVIHGQSKWNGKGIGVYKRHLCHIVFMKSELRVGK
jgi:hypothetical protein